MVIGALGVIPGCLAFSMLLSHPNLAHTTDRIVNPALFFGSLLLVVIGFIGYVRWKLNQ